MKLYPKELNSIEALRREKLKLKYARKNNDLSDLVAIDHNTKQDNFDQTALTGTLMSLVSSRSAGNLLLTLAPTVLSFVSGKKKKRFVASVLREVLGGYAKFKLMQMGYRYVKMIVKSDKK